VSLGDLRDDLLAADGLADRVVPPSGAVAWLTAGTSGAMAFLAVFALALALASGRLAERWSGALERSATVRISAPADQMAAQTEAALAILATTPGIASARALGDDEQRRLLEPWFGADLPLGSLPLPRLIEVTEDRFPFDAEGLRLRLEAEVPGAVLDDHSRWRRPLAVATERLRLLGVIAILLILAAMTATITLATMASLAANAQVIRVLRLVGARDAFIARAFVRRFTLRAFGGAVAGTAAGMVAMAVLPPASAAGGFLTGLGYHGWSWLWPLGLPLFAGAIAFAATRAAAFAKLKELT
jgi:cell division transport system permease protein